MTAVSLVRERLNTALGSVEGIRVYKDPGAAFDPPAVLVGPPSLVWESQTFAPTSARFLVYVVVAADDRALENLWGWVESVTEALDNVADCVVLRADPGTFQTGGSDLPSYEITVEVGI